MAEPTLTMILAKDGAGKHRLWACRGAGKGCNRNRFRARSAPCEDCVGPLKESLTIDEVKQMLKRGDA